MHASRISGRWAMSFDPIEEHYMKVARGVEMSSRETIGGAGRALRSILTFPMKDVYSTFSRNFSPLIIIPNTRLARGAKGFDLVRIGLGQGFTYQE